MVDKIDKPDRTTAYGVKSPTETKKDKPREERGQEDLPTFKKEEPSLYQEKFQSGLVPLKTVRVPLDRIQKMIFRGSAPYHGNPMAEADLFWKDGRGCEGVRFLLHNWQDFLKIKNFKLGEVIPPEYWSSPSGHLEVTMVQKGPGSGSWNLKEMQAAKKSAPPAHKSWWVENQIAIGIASLGIVLLLTVLMIWIAS